MAILMLFYRQKLCPALIHVLANPLADKGAKSASSGVGCGVTSSSAVNDEVGRGSGCSNSAPNVISSSAKAIYRQDKAVYSSTV